MHSVTEWVASIPDEISPREGLVFIATALDDAKQATNEIRDAFKGTIPPPPWPQPPELVKAVEALEGGQLMLNQAIALGYGDQKEPRSGAHAARLINGGRALYAAVEKMRADHRDGQIKPENAVKLVKRLLPTSLGGVAVFAGILLAMYYLDDAE